MEKNLYHCILHWRESFFRCIPQRKKTSSVVSHNGGKYLPLWDTTEENLRRCEIQCGRFFWDTIHCTRFCCGVGYNGRKISCVVGYNRKKFVCNPEPVLCCIPQGKKILFCYIQQRRKTFSVVSHNGKKLFCYIPQRKKTSSVVSHNGKKTLNLNGFTKKFVSKMILTHESGFQED